jgi:hypothetical protein
VVLKVFEAYDLEFWETKKESEEFYVKLERLNEITQSGDMKYKQIEKKRHLKLGETASVGG